MCKHLAPTDHLSPSKEIVVSNDSTPMEYGEAVWRTAEIRMKLNDMAANLNAMPPFARHFALQAMIADVTEVVKDEDPEFQKVVIQMFRDLGRTR